MKFKTALKKREKWFANILKFLVSSKIVNFHTKVLFQLYIKVIFKSKALLKFYNESWFVVRVCLDDIA